MITLEDILEEILGEIQDEHDNETAPIKYLNDGDILVKAKYKLGRSKQRIIHIISGRKRLRYISWIHYGQIK